MRELEYSSAIKDMPFLYNETCKTARLLSEGKSDADIVELSLTENIYQLSKERRRKELPLKVLTRLHSINDNLVKIIAYGNSEISKLTAFLALIKTDKLFYEFMLEVYADKVSALQFKINDDDFILFFEKKAQDSLKVASWKSENLKKVRSAYKKILIEAGLGKKQGACIEIIKVIMNDEFCVLCKDNERYASVFIF